MNNSVGKKSEDKRKQKSIELNGLKLGANKIKNQSLDMYGIIENDLDGEKIPYAKENNN